MRTIRQLAMATVFALACALAATPEARSDACEDAQRECGRLVSAECLTKIGAGAVPASGSAEECSSQLSGYLSCIEDIVARCEVAAPSEAGEPQSIRDLERSAGGIRVLPPDVLDAIRPGTALDFAKALLGEPRRTYDTGDAKGYQYVFDNAKLALLSTDRESIDAVMVDAELSHPNLGFRFPALSDFGFDLVLGETTWAEAAQEFENEVFYEDAGTWSRVYTGLWLGRDGGFVHLAAGSRCDHPEVAPVDPAVESLFGTPNIKVRLVSGGEKKITFLVMSSWTEGTHRYAFMPTNYSC